MNQTQINELPTPQGYEKLFSATGPSGLNAYIALHNTKLGPGLGGCRLIDYPSDEHAIEDVLRLSRAMTYKNAAAGLSFGGGKAVITTANPTDDMLRDFGAAVELIGGRYVSTEDMNMSVARLEKVRETTDHVVGFHTGEYAAGDPARYTSIGLLSAIEATAQQRFDVESVEGVAVVLIGIGAVGAAVARGLVARGAKLSIADIREKQVADLAEELGAQVLPVNDALFAEADLLCPCARGNLFDGDTLGKLQVRAICGAANNQLCSPEDGDALDKSGILYAPDYIANAGGVIGVSWEALKSKIPVAEREESVRKVGTNLREIYAMAEEMEISPSRAADLYAENRFLG